jgi:hypothetical protein
MKRFLFVMAMVFTVGAVQAASTPYLPEQDARFGSVEDLKVLRVQYDVSKNGGTIGDHSLGKSLPKNAVIVWNYLYIDTAFTGTNATLAFYCEDANNLKTATDFSTFSAGTFQGGAVTGASAGAFVGASAANISSPCVVQAKVATAAESTGKATMWIHYIVHD